MSETNPPNRDTNLAPSLNLLRTLRLNLTNYEAVIYEKNTDVGGTWLENRYPGCRCDIPSHSYQFSWRPKHDWTNLHAGADEIGAYLCQVWKMNPNNIILNEIEMDEKENFSQATIARFKSDPEFYRQFVKKVERDINNMFPIVLAQSPVQIMARGMVKQYMQTMLQGNEELWYLRAVVQPNVEVRRSSIKRFVPEGIELESGEVLKVDVVVCATGFDTSFCPRFPIIGRNGNLQERWRKETPKAYMSCAVDGLPNYVTFLGPNAPIGHGSVFTLTEHISKYIVSIIRKCQTEGIKAMSPSRAAVDDYFEHITAFMPRTVWGAPGGRSWFKNGRAEGPVTALHPGSRIHFFHMLEQFRGEDWEYVYEEGARGNRFAYLGNGSSTKESGPDADTTWYLDEEAVVR
ncbi:hypothetical protein N0V88_004660 [Collariella sp. IMI 366227]|nr:hypothetical protein N0V88_004660 [Collariella sp. IMI 366227]